MVRVDFSQFFLREFEKFSHRTGFFSPKTVGAAAALTLAAGCAYKWWENQKKVETVAEKHEQKIDKWIEQYKTDVAKKKAVEADDEEGGSERYTVDEPELRKLYTKAISLKCKERACKDVREVLVDEYSHRLQEALDKGEQVDFKYGDQIRATLQNIHALSIEYLFAGELLDKARSRRTVLKYSHRWKLLKLLSSSTNQCVGMFASFVLSFLIAPMGVLKQTGLKNLIVALTKQQENRNQIVTAAVLVVGSSLLQSSLSVVQDKLNEWTEQCFTIETKVQLCNALSRFDMYFFDLHSPEQVEDLICSVDHVSACIMRAIQWVHAAVTIVSELGSLWETSRYFTTWFICFVPPYFLLSSLFNYTIEALQEVEEPPQDTTPEASLSLQDYLRNFRTLRSFGREVDIMEKRSEDWVTQSSKRQSWKIGRSMGMNMRGMRMKQMNKSKGPVVKILQSVVALWPEIFKLFGTWFATRLSRQGLLDTPNLYHLVHTTFKQIQDIKQHVESLGLGWIDEHAPYAAKLLDLLNHAPDIDTAVEQATVPVDGLKGKVEFLNVNFAYPTRPERVILKNLTCTMDAGALVGLVGPSGGGKSTIFVLMQRFYEATSGSIRVDGRDIREYDVKWLRQQFGYVHQEPILFPMSIEDNIRLGRPDASREEVEEAAKLAHAYTFIMKLPEGFKTKIGKKMQLSGGQKQRVAIARALLMAPRILLMDEATSALDSKVEKEIQGALGALLKERTTVSIAHRLSTVENADHLIVVDDGAIVEQGTHSALVDQGGLYAELVQHQQLEQKLPGGLIEALQQKTPEGENPKGKERQQPHSPTSKRSSLFGGEGRGRRGGLGRFGGRGRGRDITPDTTPD